MATPPLDVPALGEGVLGRAVGKLPGGQRLPPLARLGVTFLVLALLVLAAALTDPWGFIALGSAVGMLVVASVPAAQVGLRPLTALGVAALPLFLPLLVFVAAGVVKSPKELQFAVGLTTLLAAWFGLVKPDWKRIRAVVRPDSRWWSTKVTRAQVGAPALVVALVLAFLGYSIVGVVGDSDQTARRLFIVAVGFLAGSAVLRLLSYGRTLFRALVALAIVLLLARLAIEVGVIAGVNFLEDADVAVLAAVAGGLLALAAGVEIVTTLLTRDAADQAGLASDRLPRGFRLAVLVETPVAARWLTDRAAVAGLFSALLSAVFMLCAVFDASSAGGADEDPAGTPSAGQATTRPSAMGDRELAETFSPVLLFTKDQRWTPIAVDEYLRGARIRDWERRQVDPGAVFDPSIDCPGVVKRPCYVITQNCPRGESPALCAEELRDDKAVYVRVARRKDWRGCEASKPCADGSPNPFADAKGRYADDTDILVQYWYFYPYNEWVAPVAIGDLKEVHGADWEAVTVGLSPDKPLWVAYSAHCGGTFADWRRTRVASSDPARLRPLVAVANGSQANYRVARESRVPNFAECSGIPKDRLTLVSYAANIRDRTDDSTVWEPAPDDLRLVTAEVPPMSFPGRWAPFARMTLENFRKDQRLGKDSAGPESPTLQRLWQTPMRSIFGGGTWQEG